MEALIRQLVFEHGFRIRVLKDAEKTKDDDNVNGPPEEGGTGNLKDGDNLIGKINNLVTTDLATIVGARGFLSLGAHTSFFSGSILNVFISPSGTSGDNHIFGISLSSFGLEVRFSILIREFV